MKSSRTCRGQILEAKAKDKSSRTRTRTKSWPRGQLVLKNLTSLHNSITRMHLLLNGNDYADYTK